jgi:hypothetical protein
MRMTELGGRRGRLASGDRRLARGSCGSSRLKRRRAWGVCERGGRSGGCRGVGQSRGAVESKRVLVYGLLTVLCAELGLISFTWDETYPGLFLGVLVVDDGRAGD